MYIKNDFQNETPTAPTKTRATGWHIIPNQTIKQIFKIRDYIYASEHFTRMKLKHQKLSIGHGVPLASIAALSATQGEIIAFNNTLPMWIYKDEHYYTYFQQPTQDTDFHEGESFDGSKIVPKMMNHFLDHKGSDCGQNFQPLSDEDNVMILYPGNNGCEIHWDVSDEDAGKYHLIGNTPKNWMGATKDTSTNILEWNGDITPGNRDYTATIREQVRFMKGVLGNGSGNVLMVKPIPHTLIKLEPICAPSTNKALPHYCKIFINIESTWDIMPRPANLPLNMTIFGSHQFANIHFKTTPGFNINEETGNNYVITPWKAPSGSEAPEIAPSKAVGQRSIYIRNITTEDPKSKKLVYESTNIEQ